MSRRCRHYTPGILDDMLFLHLAARTAQVGMWSDDGLVEPTAGNITLSVRPCSRTASYGR